MLRSSWLFLVCSLALSACAHQAPATNLDARRFLSLERAFNAFVADRLQSLDDVEQATAELEGLRLEYLDVLPVTVHERDRVLVLLRLAELHLDLAARVRRVPYPEGLDESARADFDARLSQRALPLEATGQGVLLQVLGRAERHRLEGRFVRRALLYRQLHEGARLADDDLTTLRAELAAGTYRAPRSLLEAGRVGQRAAR